MAARQPHVDQSQAAADDHGHLSALLTAWQASGDHESLGLLVTTIRAAALRIIESTLRHCGVRDPDAVDDAFALVLGHLRRLPGVGSTERCVTRFQGSADGGRGDHGAAFIHWLCRERALDVARSRRRRRHHEQVFSEVRGMPTPGSDGPREETGVGPHARDEDLQWAAAQLESRQRAVIEFTMEGRTLAVIAHLLGLSEGTVSRIRSRAVVQLRRILAGDQGPDS